MSLAACALNITSPAAGKPIAPVAGEAYVFGHVAIVSGERRYPPSNAPGWNALELLYIEQVRVILLRFEPRQVVTYPVFEGDGRFGWLLPAGDYLLLGAYERDMDSDHPVFWPLTALRVRPGSITCAGDLEVKRVQAPEGVSVAWGEFTDRVVDRCGQRRHDVESRHGALSVEPGIRLMVDVSDLAFDDPALFRISRQRLDAVE